MFRTGWSIIRKIKCLITQAASGTVPSVVDVSCVAVGVRLMHGQPSIKIFIDLFLISILNPVTRVAQHHDLGFRAEIYYGTLPLDKF